MNKSKQEMHVNADVTHNVHIIVGKPMPDGSIKVSTDRLFKNTATRLMTQSIAEFLAGSEHSYNRRAGRPNYMSFGTMGIKLQPNLVDITPDTYAPIDPDHPDVPPEIVEEGNWRTYLEEHFTDIVFENPEDRTRPWYESTSLALTDTCGAAVTTEDDLNPHFWDTRYGWGDKFNHGAGDRPIFQGELCTQCTNKFNINQVPRSAILRADVTSDCPQDLEYGNDGYASTVVFYGYAPVNWVNSMLRPVHTEILINKDTGDIEYDPKTGFPKTVTTPIGPELQRMALSEFGLYEKTNLDPHGLYTLFAGFRVPEIKDIVYVSRDEVILVEWRVTIRAMMPNEVVSVTDNKHKRVTGIALNAVVQDKESGDTNNYVQMSGSVIGDAGVDQTIRWSLVGEWSPGTSIDVQTGLLTVPASETHQALYVRGESAVASNVYATAAIITSLMSDFVYGIAVSTEIMDQFTVKFTPSVLYKGTVNTQVTWEDPESADIDPNSDPEHPSYIPLNPGTQWSEVDSETGVATLSISQQEQVRKIKVTVKSVQTSEFAPEDQIYTASAIVRIGQTEGAYVISDFTILT